MAKRPAQRWAALLIVPMPVLAHGDAWIIALILLIPFLLIPFAYLLLPKSKRKWGHLYTGNLVFNIIVFGGAGGGFMGGLLFGLYQPILTLMITLIICWLTYKKPKPKDEHSKDPIQLTDE